MATGIATAYQLDPTTKREIWLFQELRKIPGGHDDGAPLYKRLPYNLVRYDGDPTELIEPVNAGTFWNTIDGSGDPIDPIVTGRNCTIEMRFFRARPFEVFAYNDVDAANNLGQLP